jgi:hypothetical protein
LKPTPSALTEGSSAVRNLITCSYKWVVTYRTWR